MMEGAVCLDGKESDRIRLHHERFTLLRNSLFGYDRGRIWKIWGMSVHRIFDVYGIDSMRIFRLPSK